LASLACRRHTLEALDERLEWPSAHASRNRALAALDTIDDELDAFPVYIDYHGVSDPAWVDYVVKTPDGFEACWRPAFD
jgi:hypothetical protein